jgi:hypothetical protein
MKNLILAIFMTTTLVSCNDSTSTAGSDIYYPTPYYTCENIYDTWSNQFIFACFWVYYSEDGSSSQELDMVADIADEQSLILDKTAQMYSEKYSLSVEQGLKIARNITDLQSLKDRSANDLADFAKSLYGMNTDELISAIGQSQVGDNSALEELVEQSAIDFGTDKQTMKTIIKDLHKKALEENGINL